MPNKRPESNNNNNNSNSNSNKNQNESLEELPRGRRGKGGRESREENVSRIPKEFQKSKNTEAGRQQYEKQWPQNNQVETIESQNCVLRLVFSKKNAKKERKKEKRNRKREKWL